ncbi:M56 family metallopeptidase [Chryseobacterium sp.]|uniref:M56 family metallopeptidase n=1 Tax=Chryseobacterium sp. TaxID=1871047 RepID=UPI00334067F2
MSAIILKIILCSSIFIAIYYLFLEKERMHRFNRLYLLSSLLLSYVIPFITITIQRPEVKTQPQLILEETTQQLVFMHQEEESFNWMHIVWSIYVIITFFLLLKSIFALLTVRKIQGERQIYQHHKIILTEENLSPFSFWNTIYMGKRYMKNDTIDPRIFLHEKAHIEQKHSADLIFLGFLKIFTWFNPVLFLYHKAMVTNHEFLADEAVLKNPFSISEYQNLILDEMIGTQKFPLTHTFNFNNTKKRFIMMTTKKSKYSLLRKTAGITALITTVVLFSEKTYAHSTEDSLAFNQNNSSSNIPVDTNYKQANSNPIKNQPTEKTLPTQNSNDKKTLQESAVTAELKKEDSQVIADTISPKTAVKDGKSTNYTTDSNTGKDFVEAQYPGGNAELRKKIGNTMDLTTLSTTKGTITSTAYIRIDEKGKATQITTSGNDEVFNKEYLKTITAISNETVWQPATKNGKAVATSLKIPATMTFDNFK